jgi:tetratricopeptide (TPR) repeat protein
VKRVIGTGDYQTHYDLGIAYREMGLLEDASGEFAEASNAPELRLSALHLLALCALDSKRACDAVAHLGQALSLPELPDEQLPALRFDLARAHAATGDIAAALSLLDSVAQSDAEFPGLSDLRAMLVTQPASAPASDDEEPLERFDDLIADADRAASSDEESAARVATTGAETPAPPAQPPTDGGGKTPRRRKFSFL